MQISGIKSFKSFRLCNKWPDPFSLRCGTLDRYSLWLNFIQIHNIQIKLIPPIDRWLWAPITSCKCLLCSDHLYADVHIYGIYLVAKRGYRQPEAEDLFCQLVLYIDLPLIEAKILPLLNSKSAEACPHPFDQSNNNL